jgi:hypothetical protein
VTFEVPRTFPAASNALTWKYGPWLVVGIAVSNPERSAYLTPGA